MAINTDLYKNIQLYLNRISPVSNVIWEEICFMLDAKVYQKGEFFAKEGRKEYTFGILLDGLLRSYTQNSKGKEFTKTIFTPVYFKTPISYVGAYTSLVSNEINQVNIQALTNAKLLVGERKQWLELIKKYDEVSEWSRKLAELFFSGKEKREFELVNLDAEERYKLFRKEFPEVENLISQYYIAQFLAITPTQLSRIRKKIFSD